MPRRTVPVLEIEWLIFGEDNSSKVTINLPSWRSTCIVYEQRNGNRFPYFYLRSDLLAVALRWIDFNPSSLIHAHDAQLFAVDACLHSANVDQGHGENQSSYWTVMVSPLDDMFPPLDDMFPFRWIRWCLPWFGVAMGIVGFTWICYGFVFFSGHTNPLRGVVSMVAGLLLSSLALFLIHARLK